MSILAFTNRVFLIPPQNKTADRFCQPFCFGISSAKAYLLTESYGYQNTSMRKNTEIY